MKVPSDDPAQKAKGATVSASLVCSGGYEDDVDGGEDLWYTGSGGNDLLVRLVRAGARGERSGWLWA